MDDNPIDLLINELEKEHGKEEATKLITSLIKFIGPDNFVALGLYMAYQYSEDSQMPNISGFIQFIEDQQPQQEEESE